MNEELIKDIVLGTNRYFFHTKLDTGDLVFINLKDGNALIVGCETSVCDLAKKLCDKAYENGVNRGIDHSEILLQEAMKFQAN